MCGVEPSIFGRDLCSGHASNGRICTVGGDQGEARGLHGRRHLAVQLGNPEQGAHSDLLGIENGTAFAALPGTICKLSAAALTARRVPIRRRLARRGNSRE